jgi:hypothetical protein
VRLRRHLSYSNVLSTIAVFLAMGGGAYAVSVPRNSVGAKQLKPRAVTATKIQRNSVDSAKLRNRSVGPADLRRGLLPALAGAKARETDPPPTPGTIVEQATITTQRSGKVYVIAPLRDIFLTCGSAGPCSAHWGLYVDDRPVPSAGVLLQAGPDDGDGYDHLLFGITAADVSPGTHTLKLARSVSGSVESVGELGAQLGGLSLGG